MDKEGNQKFKLQLRIFIGEVGTVCTILKLKDGRLLAGYEKGLILIFELSNNYERLMTIDLVIEGLNEVLQMENGLVVAYTDNKEKSIIFFSIADNSYKIEHIIKDINLNVPRTICLLSNNRIASSDAQFNIKIWNSIEPYGRITELETEKPPTGIVQLKNKEILIAGEEGKVIRVWNLSTYKCEKVLKKINVFSINSIIEIADNKVICGGVGKVVVLNTNDYTIERTYKNKDISAIKCLLELSNGNILIGDYIGTIHCYNVLADK